MSQPLAWRKEPVEISEWSPSWQASFRQKAAIIRSALGSIALRIDHIGSTSIPRLAAKPIIDIQISVDDFDPIERIAEPMRQIGYVWRKDDPDLARRYFREQPGAERTHVHVRRFGNWHEQWPLLFRDYMRDRPDEHDAYVSLKRRLAQEFRDDRIAYTDGKADHWWGVIRRAHRWASETGWDPAESDA